MLTWPERSEMSDVSSPDVDGLAVISNAGADTECEVSLARVSLNGVVEVVGHGGSVRQLETHPMSVDQRTVKSGDHTLPTENRIF